MPRPQPSRDKDAESALVVWPRRTVRPPVRPSPVPCSVLLYQASRVGGVSPVFSVCGYGEPVPAEPSPPPSPGACFPSLLLGVTTARVKLGGQDGTERP